MEGVDRGSVEAAAEDAGRKTPGSRFDLARLLQATACRLRGLVSVGCRECVELCDAMRHKDSEPAGTVASIYSRSKSGRLTGKLYDRATTALI